MGDKKNSSPRRSTVATATTAGYRIGVDVGGTFTDLVLADLAGNLTIGKALTTPAKVFRGMQAALDAAAELIQRDSRDVLEDTDVLVYGTTHATNAILQRTTARTAFLTTQGFPDTLLLREGGKLNPFDFRVDPPEPYIPRRLTLQISERIDAEGEIVRPLDVRHARAVIRTLRDRQVEAVAVCLLWSVANPVHEVALGELLAEELPGVPFTLSHQLNPIIREYRRASAAAIDASLKPLMQRHLRDLDQDLREAGFSGELVVATSMGGVMHLTDVVERPIYLVKSGPAMAPVAGQVYASAELGSKNVLVCDTGGTSFDVTLVRDEMLKYTRETWLGDRWTGHMTGLSSVDVRSIGAGGGSIAWIDSGGLVRVGPQSAGADPGPACYGLGGSQATVTDASLLLGYLDAAYFLGGRMRLDFGAAERAIARLAERLGRTLDETAHGILTIANEHMVNAIKEITINEGIDPRDGVIVAGGGAAGLNIVPIAQELGCRFVLIPRTAGALSACGALYSNIVAEFSVSQVADTADFSFEAVNEALTRIDAKVDDFSRRLRNKGLELDRVDYFVEARYPYQVWELEVPLASGRFDRTEDVDALVQAFHQAHERVFAVSEPGQRIECVNWKGRLVAEMPKPKLRPNPNSSIDRPAAMLEHRSAYFPKLGRVETACYLGDSLRVGDRIKGPAVIELPTTTVVVYPGSTAAVTGYLNYLIELGKED